MANGLVRELRELNPDGAVQLPVKDARAAERLVRGRLLRWEAARRLLRVVLLFARSGLYADRAVRPGFARIVASLFQVALLILAFTTIEGHHFSSYYIF